MRTLFSFDAQMNFATGRPICFAYHPARMLPKLPVGTVFHQSRVSPDVIDDLGNEAADVDRIGRTELIALRLEFRAERGVGEHLLHAGLGVVEVAADAEDVGVLAILGDHLALLDLGDAAFGVEHADLRPGNVRESLERGLSRIAARRG